MTSDATRARLPLCRGAVGFWLGWASIVAVLAGLALDVGARHRWLLVGLTLGAAAANTVAMIVPWHEWLATRRGRVLLDLWCGGLIAFVALLVVDGGSSFALLLFLAVPFIAVVQSGWRRGFWLGVSAGTCTRRCGADPAVGRRDGDAACSRRGRGRLWRSFSRGRSAAKSSAHKQASARAELERTLAKEANHRIKNDLQTVADLLLLGRPAGGDGTAFDDTAARIRSIATVHRLLTETDDQVDGGALLRSIAESAPVPWQLRRSPPHSTPPRRKSSASSPTSWSRTRSSMARRRSSCGSAADRRRRLRVDDGGCGVEGDAGFGLELVRRMVEQGLDGRFELSTRSGGGTRAEVVFPTVSR